MGAYHAKTVPSHPEKKKQTKKRSTVRRSLLISKGYGITSAGFNKTEVPTDIQILWESCAVYQKVTEMKLQ
jgi:hypothetical protein